MWSSLLQFRLNWKEHGNGLVRMGGKENTTHSEHFVYSSYAVAFKTRNFDREF